MADYECDNNIHVCRVLPSLNEKYALNSVFILCNNAINTR